jgi:hypothetical protein
MNTMESTLRQPALGAATVTSKTPLIAYWVGTTLFCFQLGFTAYAQLSLPQVAETFTHLGFPDYFRVGLAWAKFAGIAVVLAPVPARLKEWAYAGFAFNLLAAVFAHMAVGEGVAVWGWAAGTLLLWGLSYGAWRFLERARGNA